MLTQVKGLLKKKKECYAHEEKKFNLLLTTTKRLFEGVTKLPLGNFWLLMKYLHQYGCVAFEEEHTILLVCVVPEKTLLFRSLCSKFGFLHESRTDFSLLVDLRIMNTREWSGDFRIKYPTFPYFSYAGYDFPSLGTVFERMFRMLKLPMKISVIFSFFIEIKQLKM